MIRSEFDSIHWTGRSEFLTVGGGTLVLEGEIEAQYEIGVHWRSSSDDRPTDVLCTKLRVPDSDGDIWEITSRFSAEYLLKLMGDISLPSQLNLLSENPEVGELFEREEVLKDLRYTNSN